MYERAERLPEFETVTELHMNIRRRVTPEGFPLLRLEGMENVTGSVFYRLYRVDERMGQSVLLGRSICAVEVDQEENITWYANDPMMWLSIDGVPCDMELVMESARQGGWVIVYLYNIPVQIDTKVCFLRCGRVFDYRESENEDEPFYQVYGIWEGYDEHTEMTNRNVQSLAQVAGQDFRILYPVDPALAEERQTYLMSDTMTMYRALSVNESLLPPGIYYLEYEIDDMFLRPALLERIRMHWDGVNLTFPENLAWTD